MSLDSFRNLLLISQNSYCMLKPTFLCGCIKQFLCGMRWNCTHNQNVTVCFVVMELRLLFTHIILQVSFVGLYSALFLLLTFYVPCSHSSWLFWMLFLVHVFFISSSRKCSFLNIADETVCVTQFANRYIDVRQYSGSN